MCLFECCHEIICFKIERFIVEKILVRLFGLKNWFYHIFYFQVLIFIIYYTWYKYLLMLFFDMKQFDLFKSSAIMYLEWKSFYQFFSGSGSIFVSMPVFTGYSMLRKNEVSATNGQVNITHVPIHICKLIFFFIISKLLVIKITVFYEIFF